MHEHRREHGRDIGGGMLGESLRDERPFGDEVIAAGKLDEENQDIEADQHEGDDRGDAPLRIVVADREHAAFSLFRSPCGRDHNQAKGEVYPGKLPRKACRGRLLGNAPQQNDARGRIEGGRSRPVGLTLGGYEGFSIWAKEPWSRPLARRLGFSWRRSCSRALAWPARAGRGSSGEVVASTSPSAVEPAASPSEAGQEAQAPAATPAGEDSLHPSSGLIHRG